MDLYTMEGGTKYLGKVAVRSCPIITRIRFRERDNIFALVVICRDGTTYFQAPSVAEKNEWVHVCLQNQAYLFQELEEPPSMTMFSLKATGGGAQKLFIALVNNELVVRDVISPESMLWMEKFGPEEVFIKTSATRDGKQYYISATPKGKLVATHTTKDRTACFRIIDYEKERKIAIRTIYGTLITINPSQRTVSANTTVADKNNTFTRIFPNVSVSFKSISTCNFVTTGRTSLKVKSKSVLSSEKFLLRQLPGGFYTIKSWEQLLLQVGLQTGKLSCDYKGQATTSTFFLLDRLITGHTTIRSREIRAANGDLIRPSLYITIIQVNGGFELGLTPLVEKAERFHLIYNMEP